jgi:hypothetical protein
LELKFYVNSLKPSEEQVNFKDEVFGEVFPPQDDSDGEADNDFPGVGNSNT